MNNINQKERTEGRRELARGKGGKEVVKARR